MSEEVLDQLALKMKEYIYGPGEVIFEKGKIDDKIYFLWSGEVEYYR